MGKNLVMHGVKKQAASEKNSTPPENAYFSSKNYGSSIIYGFILSVGIIFLNNSVYAQSTYTIQGKVLDAETGEAIPFANVYYPQDEQIGTSTDESGDFVLNSDLLPDSLRASFIGYKELTLALTLSPEQPEQRVVFYLKPESQELEGVVFISKEDPAMPIMRQVIKNKKKNDRRSLEQYEYDSYIKVEIFLDNLPEKVDKKPLFQKVLSTLDANGRITDSLGKPLLPLIISEVDSKHYHQNQPEKSKDVVLKHKVTAMGVGEGRYTSQLTSGGYHDYNFYSNWMNILTKDFVSPISDSWSLYYNYYLNDSMYLGNHWCYEIEIEPKNPLDLAFTGIIWIDSKSYGLAKAEVKITRGANLNFVDGLYIYQELAQTEAGPWIPSVVRANVDVTQVTKSTMGMFAKFYVYNDAFVLNRPRDISFFEEEYVLDPNAYRYEDEDWESIRPASISAEEQRTYATIDSLKLIKGIKIWTEIIRVLSTGYYIAGKVDLGHIINTYAYNNVEGHRFEFGFRTNTDFSEKYIFKGSLAYGTQDHRFKYTGSFDYFYSRRKWALVGISRSETLDRMGVSSDDFNLNPLLATVLRWGNLADQGPFRREQTSLYTQADVFRGVTQKLQLRRYTFNPVLDNFAFLPNTEKSDTAPIRSYTSSDLVLETRIARQERFLYFGNNRVSLGTKRLPVLSLRYTWGIPNFLHSDLEYHKFEANLSHFTRLGLIGRIRYQLTGGYTPSRLPVSLLFVPIGNRSVAYNFNGYNLLNFLEFTNDRYLGFNALHSFDGLIMNRIPLFRRLKWRSVILANAFVGDLRLENRLATPEASPSGNPVIQPRPLGSLPYAEVGYGISNILKFLQVTAVHRLTYRNSPLARRSFGIFFTGKFEL